ncbi:hypothetical protein GCM10010315_46000 [Streptomyces luteosporeus]|uniref:Uncharacterized protein n=1 Tax=Streptomyces luteosporeus TaxID=173856 RepID=A0ABP6GI78_9ACTN
MLAPAPAGGVSTAGRRWPIAQFPAPLRGAVVPRGEDPPDRPEPAAACGRSLRSARGRWDLASGRRGAPAGGRLEMDAAFLAAMVGL